MATSYISLAGPTSIRVRLPGTRPSFQDFSETTYAWRKDGTIDAYGQWLTTHGKFSPEQKRVLSEQLAMAGLKTQARFIEDFVSGAHAHAPWLIRNDGGDEIEVDMNKMPTIGWWALATLVYPPYKFLNYLQNVWLQKWVASVP